MILSRQKIESEDEDEDDLFGEKKKPPESDEEEEESDDEEEKPKKVKNSKIPVGEAPVSKHLQEAEKVSITGAGCLRE